MNKIKIVRIAPIHKSPLKYLLKKYPDLPDLPYKEQMSIHSMEGVSYGSGFSTAMNELDYDAHELVYDFEPMQKRWAIENSIKFNSDSYEYEILLAQLRKVQPDVVLFQGNAYMIPDKELHQLKKKIPSIKLLLLHLAYPVAPHKISCMDHIFAGYPELYEYYQKKDYLSPYYITDLIIMFLKKFSLPINQFQSLFVDLPGMDFMITMFGTGLYTGYYNRRTCICMSVR